MLKFTPPLNLGHRLAHDGRQHQAADGAGLQGRVVPGVLTDEMVGDLNQLAQPNLQAFRQAPPDLAGVEINYDSGRPTNGLFTIDLDLDLDF